MLGRTHALSGAAACAALVITAWHPGDGPAAAAGVVFAGAAVLPDIDKPGSTAARSLGFLTGLFAWLVSKASGGHRHGTHCLAGVAAFTLVTGLADVLRHTVPGLILLTFLLAVCLASALRAIGLCGHIPELAAIAGAYAITRWGYDATALPWLIGLGCVTHIAGDMMTVSGCPLLWPFSQRRFWLVPEPFRTVTTLPGSLGPGGSFGSFNVGAYYGPGRSWWQLHGERSVYLPALAVVMIILTLDAGMWRPAAREAVRLTRSERLRPVIREITRLGAHSRSPIHLAGLAHAVHLAGTVILVAFLVAALAGLAALAICWTVQSLRREAAGTPVLHATVIPSGAADPASTAEPAGSLPGPPSAQADTPYQC
jgi:membrane-bound metal-dependent hydrolase YbcI (DUF457 family)